MRRCLFRRAPGPTDRASWTLDDAGWSSDHGHKVRFEAASRNRAENRIRDPGKRLMFLTNNFVLPAETIAALYKKRWQVELFFKWIKQNLRIKHFYGTSENAVKTQIWTAVCVYVLAAIIKRELALNVSLNTFLQILSVHSFEKIELFRAFQDVDTENPSPQSNNQLNLFDS